MTANAIELARAVSDHDRQRKSPMYAKTGLGIVHWRRDQVAGQLRFAACPVDLGVPDMTVTAGEDGRRCAASLLVSHRSAA